MRLFVAVDLPANLRRWLGDLQGEVKGSLPSVRWVRPEGIHLTLKFLGETNTSLLTSIQAGLARCGRVGEPLRLVAGEAVVFPERGAPRLVWLPVGGDLAGVRRLAASIDEEMARLGFVAETREFRPHLTLGRVKDRTPDDFRTILGRLSGRPGGAFEVNEYVLFESELRPGGSVYRIIERFPLAGAAAVEAGR